MAYLFWDKKWLLTIRLLLVKWVFLNLLLPSIMSLREAPSNNITLSLKTIRGRGGCRSLCRCRDRSHSRSRCPHSLSCWLRLLRARCSRSWVLMCSTCVISLTSSECSILHLWNIVRSWIFELGARIIDNLPYN